VTDIYKGKNDIIERVKQSEQGAQVVNVKLFYGDFP
jgi:hypothetical protein